MKPKKHAGKKSETAVTMIQWAALWQNQQNDCVSQLRLRSAWASTQSDQCLRYVLSGLLRTQAFFMWTAKTLIRLDGYSKWIEAEIDNATICITATAKYSLFLFQYIVEFHSLKVIKSNEIRKGMQEKEPIMTVWYGLKNLSLGITIWHLSAISLVMPNSDPQTHQTAMKYSYIMYRIMMEPMIFSMLKNLICWTVRKPLKPSWNLYNSSCKWVYRSSSSKCPPSNRLIFPAPVLMSVKYRESHLWRHYKYWSSRSKRNDLR